MLVLGGFLFKGFIYKEEKFLLILAAISSIICIAVFMRLDKKISLDIEKLKVEK